MSSSSARSDASAVRRRRLGSAMTYSFLFAVAVVYIFPFVIAIVTSFKTEPNATADPLGLVPHPSTTSAFHELYKGQDFLLWVKNSVIVTLFILSFQGSWNELAHFIISAQSTGLNTLTKGVAQLASGQLGSGNRYPLKLAASTLMTIPVAILFFFFQRRIMNASAGAVKE